MPKNQDRALCWIRRDLRLFDHAALSLATTIADSVAVVFVFDTTILNALEDKDDRRVTFIHRSLEELDHRLRALESQLVVRYGDPIVEIPRLSQELGCKTVVTARDYEPYAKDRDSVVKQELEINGIEFRTVKDSVIFEGGEVLSQSGMPFKVYTPYSRAWRVRFESGDHAQEFQADLNKLIPTEDLVGVSSDWSLPSLGFQETDLWLSSGEDAGRSALDEFRAHIDTYGEQRDYPAKPGTSGLSVHFRFGTVSIREAVRMAREIESPGADKWLGELIWRDFYQDILFHNPEVVYRTFQADLSEIEYPGEETWFEAWKQGQTGYPIIDAAMRCFNETGWMHNRLRMIVASFLTKDLLTDFRKGEAYFARYLLDFDLASNNGGWQWAASTGADAQPYFRIFNPTLQSAKFDPEGEFIRKWVPELAQLIGNSIHCPSDSTAMELAAADVELGGNYPYPIVDHSEQRVKAISLLQSARKT